MKKLVSWNVNGIRACAKKGFVDWLTSYSPDVLAVQETKAQPDQLDETLLEIPGYHVYWQSAERKGYSGVAVYTRNDAEKTENLGIQEFDREGRTLIAHFPDFVLVNCYFPNSQEAGARLAYKIDFCDAVLEKCNALRDAGKKVVLCGDYNIAHTEIDLKNPKSNENNPGYFPAERDWMTKFLANGYKDVFRDNHPGEPGHYTWWSYRFQARQKDIGWRIDYFCVNREFADNVANPMIHKYVMGSDHCPVSIDINT